MQWGTALGQGIEMGKSIANMCGIKTEAAQDIQGTIDGTLTMTMTGNIETTAPGHGHSMAARLSTKPGRCSTGRRPQQPVVCPRQTPCHTPT